MDFGEQIQLGHLLLNDRRCKNCGEIKNLIEGFFIKFSAARVTVLKESILNAAAAFLCGCTGSTTIIGLCNLDSLINFIAFLVSLYLCPTSITSFHFGRVGR